MKNLLFTIRDSAAEYYQDPVFARTRAEILRSLMMAMRDEKNPLSVHAEHFSLFELGSFDPVTAAVELHKSPQLVVNLWDLPKVDR